MKCLFKLTHDSNKHCNLQALLGIIRQRFWPIKGKVAARATVRSCMQCNNARPKWCQQVIKFPNKNYIAKTVCKCSQWFLWPLWIHYKIRGKKPTKAYATVLCCFATKAVHFELVSDWCIYSSTKTFHQKQRAVSEYLQRQCN